MPRPSAQAAKREYGPWEIVSIGFGESSTHWCVTISKKRTATDTVEIVKNWSVVVARKDLVNGDEGVEKLIDDLQVRSFRLFTNFDETCDNPAQGTAPAALELLWSLKNAVADAVDWVSAAAAHLGLLEAVALKGMSEELMAITSEPVSNGSFGAYETVSTETKTWTQSTYTTLSFPKHASLLGWSLPGFPGVDCGETAIGP